MVTHLFTILDATSVLTGVTVVLTCMTLAGAEVAGVLVVVCAVVPVAVVTVVFVAKRVVIVIFGLVGVSGDGEGLV